MAHVATLYYMRPYILISNDDGYQAGGINHLIEVLRPIADLLVVAPDGARSGYSCSITTQVPMKLNLLREEEGFTLYACTGSPVDCIKMAFNILLPRIGRTPDLVIGGINHGDNSSVNTYYSGTMGIVTEGTFQRVPSIGFSLCDMAKDADFSACDEYIVKIVQKVIAEGLPPYTCLNVNFPKGEIKGIRVCRMAKSTWIKEVAACEHPTYGFPYYWLTGEVKEYEPEATDTDRWALYHGYAAITPQTLDSTSYSLLETFKL